jgi:hypothetical protein
MTLETRLTGITGALSDIRVLAVDIGIRILAEVVTIRENAVPTSIQLLGHKLVKVGMVEQTWMPTSDHSTKLDHLYRCESVTASRIP